MNFHFDANSPDGIQGFPAIASTGILACAGRASRAVRRIPWRLAPGAWRRSRAPSSVPGAQA